MNNHIPQPKFSVGEVVILQPYLAPHLHGKQVTIKDLDYASGFLTNGQSYKGWCYWTDEKYEEYDGLMEASLRKKHDGSEFTFDQLMSTLKQPCNV